MRATFFTIFGIVVAFILFVVFLLVRQSGQEKVVEQVPLSAVASPKAGAPSSFPSSDTAPLASVPSSPVSTPSSIAVTAFVRSFAERFGSFSNQSDFENIRELRSFMAPAMEVWADRFITESRAKAGNAASYYGVTTRVVQTKVVTMDENAGAGEILAKTQRREVRGSEAPRLFTQDLSVVVKKIDGTWKVEQATWR